MTSNNLFETRTILPSHNYTSDSLSNITVKLEDTQIYSIRLDWDNEVRYFYNSKDVNRLVRALTELGPPNSYRIMPIAGYKLI